MEWDRLLIQAMPLIKPRGRREPPTTTRPTVITTTKKTNAKVEIDHTREDCTRYNGECAARSDYGAAGRSEKALQCDHRFHADCLAGWEKSSTIVRPNCRESLRPGRTVIV